VPPVFIRFSACEVKNITLPSEEIDTAVEAVSPKSPFLFTEIGEMGDISSADEEVIREKKIMVARIEVIALKMGGKIDFFSLPELSLLLENIREQCGSVILKYSTTSLLLWVNLGSTLP